MVAGHDMNSPVSILLGLRNVVVAFEWAFLSKDIGLWFLIHAIKGCYSGDIGENGATPSQVLHLGEFHAWLSNKFIHNRRESFKPLRDKRILLDPSNTRT